MTVFYCVRHGKTHFNQQHIFQGGLADSPLLPEGIANAQKVGQHLATLPIDFVYASPQKRAQDTAEQIITQFPNKLTIQTLPNLREMEFGTWDGNPESDYHHLPEFQKLVNQPHLYDPTENGGESFAQLNQRIKHAFQEIGTNHPHDHVLIVSHGLALLTFLKTIQGVPLADVRQGDMLSNTSVTTVKLKKQVFQLETWNDTSFLA